MAFGKLFSCGTKLAVLSGKDSAIYVPSRVANKSAGFGSSIKQLTDFNRTIKQLIDFNRTVKQLIDLTVCRLYGKISNLLLAVYGKVLF